LVLGPGLGFGIALAAPAVRSGVLTSSNGELPDLDPEIASSTKISTA
jgi:hypothetical protein